MSDENRSAFPQPIDLRGGGGGGMSLREYFAGQALAGMLCDPDRLLTYKGAAKKAVGFADAMLAELAAPAQPEDKKEVAAPVFAKQAPRGVTSILVAQMLKSIYPNAASPVQIIAHIDENNGVRLAATTVRRALDHLVGEGLTKQVEGTKTWRFVPEGT